MFRRQRLEHAELVAVGVGHDDPADVDFLTDVHQHGAEAFQPRELGGPVLRAQVKGLLDSVDGGAAGDRPDHPGS